MTRQTQQARRCRRSAASSLYGLQPTDSAEEPYFFEDGLWEITVGLWMALTVALPLLVGGAAGKWSPVVVLLTSVVPVSRGRTWGRPVVIGLAAALIMGTGAGVSRRLDFWDAGGHLMIGAFVGSCLLVAAWRWRQRRWFVLAVTLALLATGVASSGMQRERALAAHAAGIACALVVSGTVAFVSYLHRAPKPRIDPDGR